MNQDYPSKSPKLIYIIEDYEVDLITFKIKKKANIVRQIDRWLGETNGNQIQD